MFRRGIVAALALTTALSGTQVLFAQNYWDRDPYADRYDRNGRYDAYRNVATIDPGTVITIRTQQPIDTNARDGRVYTGIVQDDVWDNYHRLAVPMIRRGSPAELLVRTARDGDLILDLESVTVGRERYSIDSPAIRVEADRDRRNDNNTAQYAAGGAILGAIVGAIAGGGKGAVVGGIAGGAGGAALSTQGRRIHVPAGSLLTFETATPLQVGVRDDGYRRDGVHYHRDRN
jgi:hypothetical protein